MMEGFSCKIFSDTIVIGGVCRVNLVRIEKISIFVPCF